MNKKKLIYTCGVYLKKPCAKGETNFPKNCPTVERRDIVFEVIGHIIQYFNIKTIL